MKFNKYYHLFNLSDASQAVVFHKKDELGWTPSDVFVVTTSGDLLKMLDDMEQFCEQLEGRHHIQWGTDFWFELESDALLFKLAWSEHEFKLD